MMKFVTFALCTEVIHMEWVIFRVVSVSQNEKKKKAELIWGNFIIACGRREKGRKPAQISYETEQRSLKDQF